jgi:glucose-1-phosphate adenylyltransferase
MDNVVSIILAGGRGMRMNVLSQMRAKPMLSFGGGFHVIDFVLTNCLHSGVKEIAALVDYNRYDVEKYLNEWHRLNGTGQNLQVLEPKRNTYKGTADAVYQNIEYLEKHITGDALILAADHIYKMDYRKMLAFHRKVNADATIGVVTVPVKEAHRFGIVKVSNEGKIVEFVEKPKTAHTNLGSMGIYIIKIQTLLEYLIKDASNPDSPHDFGHAIIPEMVGKDNVFAYKFNDYWQDIGTVDAYYQANMDLIQAEPPFDYNSSWTTLTGDIQNTMPVKVHRQNNITNSLICPGCIIKGTVQNSIISTGVIIEEKALVKNSVVLAHSTIGQHSIVDRCILDEDINIGATSYIGYTTNLFSGISDITLVGKGSTVPSNTAIGCNCTVAPGVGPGDFLKKAIPPNTVLAHI